MASSQGSAIIALTVLFEAFASIAVVLLLWSLRVKRRKLATYDSLTILGYITVTCLTVVLILSVTLGGLGSPPDIILSPQMVALEKLLLPLQVFYSSSITLSRLATLSLYVDFFGTQAVKFRRVCYFVMVVCLLWWVGETVMIFAICRPFAYNWDKSINGTCGNKTARYMSVTALNFVINLAVTLLPSYIIWKLHMPTARKIGIMVLFSLGLFICAIGLARLVLYQRNLDVNDPNSTVTSTKLYIFTSIEPQLAVTLACIPLLGPATEKLAPRTKKSWIRSLFSTDWRAGEATDPGIASSGYINMDSPNGLGHDAKIERGAKPDYLGSPVRTPRDTLNIYVSREFELQSLETNSRLEWDDIGRQETREPGSSNQSAT